MHGIRAITERNNGNNRTRQIDALKNATRDKHAELFAVVNYLVNDYEELGYVTDSTLELARRVQSAIRDAAK